MPSSALHPLWLLASVFLSGSSGTCLGLRLIDRRPLGIPSNSSFCLLPITEGGSGLRTYLENVFVVAFKNLLCN